VTKEPFEDAQGQVERSTQDISETEEAKQRQADLQERTTPQKNAEGEKLPGQERASDRQSSTDD